jgi:multiple sugar transport system permease protein
MVGAYTLLSFLASWYSVLWPQIVLQDENKYTLPMGLTGMIGIVDYETQYGVLMAGTLLAVLPVLVLFFVLQKDFIAGLASGAVKG